LKTTARILSVAALASAFTGLAQLATPAPSDAFTTIGGSLGLSQRDLRVWNSFGNPQANNNTTPHPNFPGAVGAPMAIWKGAVEWASVPVGGNGLGDGVPSNATLGSGGANFDAVWEGETFGSGSTNDNVHSEGGSCGGGTLAFTETPISNGWRIIYCAEWTWQDGPGDNNSIDLQGVATHEHGHALGLGHSSDGNSTMFFAITGDGVPDRSINNDDQAGVQFIYGSMGGNKCEITGISGSTDIGDTLTISGQNFSANGNEVWFTKFNSNGVPVKLTNVSSTGGGTQIQVSIPNGVQDGNVVVKNSNSGGAALSNAWPIDIGTGGAAPPFVSGVDPSIGQAGGFTEVTITGFAFEGTTSVQFGGNEANSFTVDNDGQITALTPSGQTNTTVDIDVTNADGTGTLPTAFQYTFNNPPMIDTVTPNNGPDSGGTIATITGGSVVGADKVEFGGVAGTGLVVNSATELEVTTPPGPVGDVDVKITIEDGVLGFNTDVITDGFTYTSGGPAGNFVQFGTGSPGILGVPDLDGSGDLTPGGTGFTIDLTNAAPLAPVTLFVSAVQDAVPFKGQTLYTFPILVQIPLGNTSLTGALSLPGTIPASTPGGVSVFLQEFITDDAGVQGLSSTNGLELQIP